MEFVIAAFFLVALLNFLTAYQLHRVHRVSELLQPMVSVLIPARNEEQNLQRLIPSLIASEYRSFEILILDDESADKTFEVSTQLLENSSIPFKVLQGQAWNPNLGMSGKNWACHQLSKIAKGQILIFCDADVTISNQTILQTVQLMLQNNSASGVSGLPSLVTPGQIESLVLPWILQIPLMIALPLKFAWRLPFASMQMANGQWLAIWKENYDKIQGHRGLGTSVVEDVEMAKKLVGQSLGGLIPALAARSISVHMYQDWKSMRQGFSKNLVAIYGGNSVVFVMILMLLNLIFFSPFAFLMSDPNRALICMGLLLGLRLLVSWAFHEKGYSTLLSLILLWPSLLILNFFCLQILLFRDTEWKGRSTSLPRGSL